MRFYLQYKSDTEDISAVADAVKTLETVAASRVLQMRRSALAGQQYISAVRQMLASFAMHGQHGRHPLLERRTEGEELLVAVGGERGLVGGLYDRLADKLAEGGGGRLIVVGSKLSQVAAEEGVAIRETRNAPEDLPDRHEVQELSGYLVEQFMSGTCRSVDILYPRFYSLASQRPEKVRFLPLDLPVPEGGEPTEGLPIFSPNAEAVADALLRRHLDHFLYSIISEAKLSEFAARMVATEHAGAQADEQIRKTRLRYFKERRRDFSLKQIESFFVLKSL